MPWLGLPDVGLDLVVVLALLGGLDVGRVPRRGVARRMGLDLGLVVLALLVRHCSSFESLRPMDAVISQDVTGRTNLPTHPSNSQPTLRLCASGRLQGFVARIRARIPEPTRPQRSARRR